jgi:hypothetical protein
MLNTTPDEPLRRTVASIRALRTALAYEAGTLEVHTSYQSFPKLGRNVADGRVRRARELALEGSRTAGKGLTSGSSPDELLAAATAEESRLRTKLTALGDGVASLLLYKTFPKSRRGQAEAQVARIAAAVSGNVADAYAAKSTVVFTRPLLDLGAPSAYGVDEWLGEVEARTAAASK